MSVSVLKHLLAESRIPGAHIQDLMIFIDMGGQYIFEPAEALEPVERFWIST